MTIRYVPLRIVPMGDGGGYSIGETDGSVWFGEQVDRDTIKDAPNLQAVAAFLADHPETGAALTLMLNAARLPVAQYKLLRGLAKAIGGGE